MLLETTVLMPTVEGFRNIDQKKEEQIQYRSNPERKVNYSSSSVFWASAESSAAVMWQKTLSYIGWFLHTSSADFFCADAFWFFYKKYLGGKDICFMFSFFVKKKYFQRKKLKKSRKIIQKKWHLSPTCRNHPMWLKVFCQMTAERWQHLSLGVQHEYNSTSFRVLLTFLRNHLD